VNGNNILHFSSHKKKNKHFLVKLMTHIVSLFRQAARSGHVMTKQHVALLVFLPSAH